jgi:hypothetical protein
MNRRDYAREVRNALSDVRRLCDKLGLTEGAKRQTRGLLVRCPVHGEREPSCSITTGPDGTVRVRCFACDFSGDALTLVAHQFGLSLNDDFLEVLATAAEIGNHHVLAAEIRDGRPAPNRKPVPAPEPQPEPEYPPTDEVAELWAACAPANDDPEASALLVSRRIDPDVVTELDLARVIRREPHPLPRWAAYGGRSWVSSGHRLVVRAWSASGALTSVRAWRVTDGDTPKRLPPAGHKAAELVQANREAWLMLTRRACPLRLYVVEGEPDWVCAATTFGRGDAVIGIGSGSWTPTFASRVPFGTRVIVATHADEAGDRYAARVLETLDERHLTYRWRMVA